MRKPYLLISLLLLLLCSCTGRSSSPPDAASEIVGQDLSDLQMSQGQVLPPYGKKVLAEGAVIKLRLSSSFENPSQRLDDIQAAREHIKALASEHGSISLVEVTNVELNTGYLREMTAASRPESILTTDVTIDLGIELKSYGHDLLRTIAVFNDFLATFELSETITVQVLYVEIELGDLEKYRQQLITRVYKDMHAVQSEYGPDVKFEVTGLYDALKTIQITDVEFYIYLEPVVVITEF